MWLAINTAYLSLAFDRNENSGQELNHPRLQELLAYTGKRSLNEAVQRMFPAIAR